MSLTDMSKNLKLSKPEISRHLNILMDQNLILRSDNDRTYVISDLGEVLLKIVSPFNFILEKYDFFKNHSLNFLPIDIIKDIDMLQGAELIDGTGFIFNKMEELGKLPAESVKIIIDQPFPDFRENNVDHGYFIVPERLKNNNGFEDVFKQKYANYRVQMLQIIHYPIGIINEEYGFLFLPDSTGKVDYNYCLYTQEQLGIEFINKIWSYYWNQSRTLFSKS